MTQNKSGIYSGLAVKSSHFLKPCKHGREFFLSRFLVGVWLLYNAVLVSAVQQRASAIRIHVSPPSWACLPPPNPPPVLHDFFPPAVYFKHDGVYVSTLLSQFIPPTPSPVLSTSPALCLRLDSHPANRFVSTTFLDSIYMHYCMILLTSVCNRL